MTARPDYPTQGVFLIRPPYSAMEPLDLSWCPEPPVPGVAVAWFMAPSANVWGELAWITTRPRTLPLFVILPGPEDIMRMLPVMRRVPVVKPKGVLPGAGTGTVAALRALLVAPPPSLSSSILNLLEDEGMIDSEGTRQRVHKIFTAAPHTSSIDRLAKQMCLSRRTLGRHFRDRNLPVPSHWLQFARVLHVAIQLQNTRLNINRVSARFGYPDGFTMSHTMKRLTGYRPSFIREHLGWEWIVAAWLRMEGRPIS